MKVGKIKAITFLFIGIIGLLIVNKAIFIHSHKTENGTIITHCHPYNKSNDTKPFKSHGHTNSEFILFENLKFFLPFLILQFVFLLHAFIAISTSQYIFKPARIWKQIPQNRAPPV